MSARRILAHYLNTTPDPITGQITIKFRFVETNQVQFLAAQMFLNNGDALFYPPTPGQHQGQALDTNF